MNSLLRSIIAGCTVIAFAACSAAPNQGVLPQTAATVDTSRVHVEVTEKGEHKIYNGDQLLDTIRYAEDGSVVDHHFSNGRVTVVSKQRASFHRLAVARVSPRCHADLAAIEAAQLAYDAATAALLLTLGINVVADIATVGAALIASGTNVVAFATWQAAQQGLDAAILNAKADGC